ncbi:hypothetical protein [Paraburkholderia sp. BCC1884]|uniref:hypothetical protein n=1 Tax=Paraburkholderia sp. BCC1884 TaxID=2562668 RepID=UPI001183A694|nr:hypothetical protein [Paraburkholderia sp. BCC1884]
MDLAQLVEEKINESASRIIKGGVGTDDISLGKLSFYMALRRVQQKKATAQDLGLMDAINDTLQALALVKEGRTFYQG